MTNSGSSTERTASVSQPRRIDLQLLLLLALLAWGVYDFSVERTPTGAKSILFALGLLCARAAEAYVRARPVRWSLNGLALICISLVIWIRIHA